MRYIYEAVTHYRQAAKEFPHAAHGTTRQRQGNWLLKSQQDHQGQPIIKGGGLPGEPRRMRGPVLP